MSISSCSGSCNTICSGFSPPFAFLVFGTFRSLRLDFTTANTVTEGGGSVTPSSDIKMSVLAAMSVSLPRLRVC
ncbi:hypothetical protein PILCRDRAFT_814976, partial [Piloderma croceum F 1598]